MKLLKNRREATQSVPSLEQWLLRFALASDFSDCDCGSEPEVSLNPGYLSFTHHIRRLHYVWQHDNTVSQFVCSLHNNYAPNKESQSPFLVRHMTLSEQNQTLVVQNKFWIYCIYDQIISSNHQYVCVMYNRVSSYHLLKITNLNIVHNSHNINVLPNSAALNLKINEHSPCY